MFDTATFAISCVVLFGLKKDATKNKDRNPETAFSGGFLNWGSK